MLFFILAGAELHLEALLHMGFIGMAYVAARSLGKYLGCRVGARAAGMSSTFRTWLGPAMLAQAGLAIGLANIVAAEWPGQGKALQNVILRRWWFSKWWGRFSRASPWSMPEK